MQSSLIDQSAIMSLAEIGTLTGNNGYLISIFETFKSSFSKDLSEILDQNSKQNYARVKLLSHRMKSSARTVGAKALADIFASVEYQLSQDVPDIASVEDLLSRSNKVFADSQMALSPFYKN